MLQIISILQIYEWSLNIEKCENQQQCKYLTPTIVCGLVHISEAQNRIRQVIRICALVDMLLLTTIEDKYKYFVVKH